MCIRDSRNEDRHDFEAQADQKRFYRQSEQFSDCLLYTSASTGINEKAAQAAGIAYDKVVLFPASHATYYPGAHSMAMKVLYEKESLRLLGAQIVAYRYAAAQDNPSEPDPGPLLRHVRYVLLLVLV